MKVREERVLSDRKVAKAGSQFEELLAACWEATDEHGPYDFGNKPIDWGSVLQGDRFFTLLNIRALTYGPEYGFAVSCRNCRARIEWEVNLRKLPVRSLAPESREAFMAGNRFETTLPSAGNRVWFKLVTGDDERKLPALQRAAPDRLLSSVLAYRVLERSTASNRRTSAPSSKTSRSATPTSSSTSSTASIAASTPPSKSSARSAERSRTSSPEEQEEQPGGSRGECGAGPSSVEAGSGGGGESRGVGRAA